MPKISTVFSRMKVKFEFQGQQSRHEIHKIFPLKTVDLFNGIAVTL